MKRRNVDCIKPRRLLKRPKLGEGFYGNSFIYIKFLVVWLLVIGADFLFEFRFEYLWPFWLLLRSVYDSFRYQGLAFSILFVCMALTSDMICLLFIPVNWLFFAASTYVWVQFVWHSERGICMPSVALWVLFIYIEALVRMKDIKNAPFHLDLCRPFAAHCIGYPVVTLGFGLKSYVGYRLRQRKQREVAKENEFYFEVLKDSLPQELRESASEISLKEKTDNMVILSRDLDVQSNHTAPRSYPGNCNGAISNSLSSHAGVISRSRSSKSSLVGESTPRKEDLSPPPSKVQNGSSSLHIELEYMQKKGWPCAKSVNDFNESEAERDKNVKSLNPSISSNSSSSSSPQGGSSPVFSSSCSPAPGDMDSKKATNSSSFSGASLPQSNGSAKFSGSHPNNLKDNGPVNVVSPSPQSRDKKAKINKDNNNKEAASQANKEASLTIVRLEADVKRLKVDLQHARQTEQDLKNQVNTLLSKEKSSRQENNQLQQDNDNLQNKLHNLVTGRQSDRSTISSQERKLQEEKKCRQVAENQLAQLDKKVKKLDEQIQSKTQALIAAKAECSESCRSRKDDIEIELKRLRREVRANEERCRGLERDNVTLRQYKDSQGEAEVLMSALTAMQEKTAQLESSLSAENKVKLDLFSALGETKRQLSIAQSQIAAKEKEIEELKTKFTEVLAVCSPTSGFPTSSAASSDVSSSRYYSSRILPPSSTAQMSNSLDSASSSLSESLLGSSSSRDAHASIVLPSPFSQQQRSPTSPISPISPKGMTSMTSMSSMSSHHHQTHAHAHAHGHHQSHHAALSNLDPNARVYTPKNGTDEP